MAGGGVDQILRERQARSRPPRAGLAASLLLHALVVASVILVPRLFAEPRRPLEFVPITVVPVQALGVENAGAARRPSRPEPPKPEPPAPKEPEPRPPAPDPEVPALPEEAPRPAAEPEPPAPAPPKPPKPEPAAPTPDAAARPSGAGAEPAAGGPPGRPGRPGDPRGSALSTSQFGAVGVEDPDFTYGYYLDQMLAMIRAQWVRPPLGSGVQATVHFRIQSDGRVSDVEIVESSGYSSFDLAGLRAVQSASPLPPLPRSYKRESLGVNLVIQ